MTTNDLIENDWNEEERRAYERYSVEFYLSVYDRKTNIFLGHVVDISLGGMQLLSETPIASGQLFRLRMDVSLESGRKEQIEFDAWSIWRTEDLNPGFYNAGFQFLDLSPTTGQSIQGVIDEIVADL